MENYVITGATGHLGYTLVKQLLNNKNINIKLLVLDGEDVSIFANMNVEIKFGNVLDIDFLNKEISTNDTVFHLAGIIDISSANKDLLYNVNVNGTKNIATICKNKQVKKFIYTSSVHAIEPLKKGQVLVEPVIFDENKIVGDYAKSKTMATKIVFNLISEGLNGIVVYPSGIIGPNDIKVSEMGSLLLDIVNKKIKARVSGGYNFVDVRDVANGIIAAAQQGIVGEGYILSGHMVSVTQLFKIVNKRFKRTKIVPIISMWFVKMFAKLAEFYYKIRNKKPLFTSYSLYTLSSNHNFSNAKAKQALGFQTRSTEQSVYDAIDWFVANKKHLLTESALKEYYKHIQANK